MTSPFARLLCLFVLSATLVPGLMAQVMEKVNLLSTGGVGWGECRNPSLSANGRYVAFASNDDLIGGDPYTQYHFDVFVYDRQTGQMRRINAPASRDRSTQGLKARESC